MCRCQSIGRIVLLVALVTVGFCTSKVSASPEDPIKVGILHSTTGTMAISEQSLVDAALLAIEEINRAGGIMGRQIHAITEDGASDWDTFALKAEKLIVEDQVSSVFGCWTSASRKAVLPVFEKYHNLLWYPVQYEGFESSQWVIYTGAVPNQQIIPALQWSLANLGTRVFLVGSDYVFPRTANRIIKEYLDEDGGTCVGEEYLPLGDKNFQQIVEKIRLTKPDVVFNTINGDSNMGLFTELRAAGIGPQDIPVMSVSIAEDEVRKLGTYMTAGHYCAWSYFQSIDTPENRQFVDSFRKSYGINRVTDDPIEAAYFQVYLFANAVAKAGSTDPQAIREAALGMEFVAPGGPIRIDPKNQHTWKTPRIGQVQDDGQFKIIWNSEMPIKPDPSLESGFDMGSAWEDKSIQGVQGAHEVSDIPYLIDTLSAQNSIIRQRAAMALRDFGEEARMAAPSLGRALNDDDWLVRRFAAEALEKMSPTSIVPLTNAIDDTHCQGRLLAITAIKRIGAPAAQAVPTLVQALESSDPEIRVEATAALGAIGYQAIESIPALANMLQDRETSVRLAAVNALESIGSGRGVSLPILTIALENDRAQVRTDAVSALRRIAQDIGDQQDTSAIPILEEALVTMRKGPFSNEDISAVNSVILHLKNIEEGLMPSGQTSLMMDLKTILGIGLVGIIALWYILLWGVGVRWFPRFILTLSRGLPNSPPINLPEWLGGFEITIRSLLLANSDHHLRVLDTWVGDNIKAALDNFKEQSIFETHDFYLPLPVKLAGSRHRRIEQDDLSHLNETSRWCLLIVGEGGSGKTALAYQLGLWAASEIPAKRLCRDRMMIPILIEAGLGLHLIDDVPTLLNTIHTRLHAMVATCQQIPKSFTEQLLSHGRILLIIDDLGKVTDEPWPQPHDDDFLVGAMIVTSRTRDKLVVPYTVIEPLLIQEIDLLNSFLDECISILKGGTEFTYKEMSQSWRGLASLVGRRGRITPLFVKMYAKYLIGKKESGEIQSTDVPTDIPDLMLAYLNELNRTRQTSDPDDRTVQKALKIIAWECLKNTYRPGVAQRNHVVAALNIPTASKMLSYLEDRLQLIRTTGSARDNISFVLDPLAEYLAGLHLVEEYADSEEKWQGFLANPSKMGILSAEIEEFILAVRDCCLSTAHGKGLPNYLPAELAQRAGLEVEPADFDPIKIGVLHSLTGNMSFSERSLVDSANIAIKEINNAGGIMGRQIHAIAEDGASDWDTFVLKAEKLIVEDHVSSVFGCWTSASRKAVLPVFEKYHNLLWYPVQYEGFESSQWVIYTGAVPNQQIIPALQWSLANLGTRVFLVGSDYVFPRTANRIIKEYLDEEGGTCVGEEYLPLGDKNFQQIVEKIRLTKPDVVFNTINGDSNIGLFTDLRAAGIGPQDIPVMSVSIAEDEVRSIGAPLTTGHYCTWSYFQSIDTPENRQFVDSFQKSYGINRVTDDPIEAAYFQVYLFAKAVAKAGSTDPRAIREAALGMEFAAPGGPIRIDPENQHTWKTPRIGQVQDDGQFKIIWNSEMPIKPDPFPHAPTTAVNGY